MCHDVWYSDITANMETFKLTETASLIIRSVYMCREHDCAGAYYYLNNVPFK